MYITHHCVTFTPWRHGVTSRDVMTSWRHGVTSHDFLCHDSESTWAIQSEVSKIHVFQHGDLDLWPMTLTFELVQDIIEVHTSTKFWVRTSNRSAVRALTDGQTDGQTNRQTGPILYPRPLTREGIIISFLINYGIKITLFHLEHAISPLLVMG